MPNPLPIVPDSTFTERKGIHHVGWAASEMGFVWREVPNTDLGIDGYLEVTVNGAPIGLIAAQVKSGKSYMESPTEDSFVFRAESKHVRYWLSYRLPVIIIIFDPEERAAYWRSIQEYFQKHDEEPQTSGVPIRIAKSSVFDETRKCELTEIAATPDSTAPAMLALRASRYEQTREHLTSIELVELYGKRKWLGGWLPLDEGREQILLHSAMAGNGPGWYWFRSGSDHDYIPHLRSALSHPNYLLCSEAALALAAALGRKAVDDLMNLTNADGDHVMEVARALASIPDLSQDQRRRIAEDYWAILPRVCALWPGRTCHELRSYIAKIGGPEARDLVLEYYGATSGSASKQMQMSPSAPTLLRTAAYLWSKDEVPEVRSLMKTSHPGMRALAMAAISILGSEEDLDAVWDYILDSQWHGHEEDRNWLARQVARLFDAQDVTRLREMLHTRPRAALVVYPVLPDLCRRLDRDTLIGMLEDQIPRVKSYAIEGLIAIGEADLLLEHRSLLESGDWSLSERLVKGIVSTGNQGTIDWIIENHGDHKEAVAEGLRYVNDEVAVEYLFELLRDEDASLKAAESLSMIGDEQVLSRIVDWLLEHPYEPSSDVTRDVLIHLDRRLYCPIEWEIDIDRDFSARRYSMRRYER